MHYQENWLNITADLHGMQFSTIVAQQHAFFACTVHNKLECEVFTTTIYTVLPYGLGAFFLEKKIAATTYPPPFLETSTKVCSINSYILL
jgi:hypothetical protein